MQKALSTPTLSECRWSIHNYGQYTWSEGSRYWWDNRDRYQEALWVIQLQTEGEILYRDYEVAGSFKDTTVHPHHAFIFNMHEQSAYGWPGLLPTPMTNLWLTIRGAGLSEHMNAYRSEYGPIFPCRPNTQLQRQFMKLYKMAGLKSTQALYQIAEEIHRLLMTMFEQAELEHREQLSPVQSAIRALLQHPTHPWSLKILADEHGVSREHLTRCFIEEVGESPARYLNDHRTRRALELLSTTDLPLKHIAEQAGFPSMKTLNRQIRSHTGQTPHAWRKLKQSH